MSDDFAICNNCKCFDAGYTTPEKVIINIMNEIVVYGGLEPLDDEAENDIAFAIKKAKEIIELSKHLENEEKKCSECGEWATFNWKHVEYGLDD